MKTTKYVLLAALLLPGPAFAQAGVSGQAAYIAADPFLDPSFQDFVETAYGYRNPKHTPGVVNDLRDSLTDIGAAFSAAAKPAAESAQRSAEGLSPAAAQQRQPAGDKARSAGKSAPGQNYKVTFANEGGPLSSFVGPLDSDALSGFKAGSYAFISVLPKTGDHDSVIRSLAASGFKFAGEKTSFTGDGKKTFLLGWVPYAKLGSIYKNPKVRQVAIENNASGVPFRTRIRFTLRAPSGEFSGAFVEDFIRRLGLSADFVSEGVSRVPQNSGGSKFAAFEITGTLPVDKIGNVSLSPFVAAVEFQDKSL